MEVSNPDRIMFPGRGFTKADVVGYYESAGETMLRFLSGRPLTLQRFPKGIEAKGFMQKNAAKHYPASIGRHQVPKRGGDFTTYAVVDRAEDLAYLANQGTVTFHMMLTSAAMPSRPDWLVIDLDPTDGDVAGVRKATQAIGELLQDFDLNGFPLATGSSGFHVWVPLDGSIELGQVSMASRALAGIAALRHPENLTTEFLKKNRKGRVFVDWLRSGPIATVVVPFSLRPRSNAPIAVPLTWTELVTAVPDGWTLDTIGDRADSVPNLDVQQLPAADIIDAARNLGVDLDTPHDRFGR